MELNANLISIQGIISSANKKYGPLSKIKYKGGNEIKVSGIVNSLDKYLGDHMFIIDNKINLEHTKELTDIILLLTLNCEFSRNFEIAGSEHLTNIMPSLSKCILSNIIIDLGLTNICCKILPKLPIHVTRELLEEIMQCIKKLNPNQTLENTYAYIKTVIEIMKSSECELDNEAEEDLEEIINTLSEPLLLLTGVKVDTCKTLNINSIHSQMGYTIYYLLQLLKDFSEAELKNRFLLSLWDKLKNAVMTVMEAVTIEVFCSWYEIDYNGFPLQTAVANDAFTITEKYKNFKPAKELIQMLQCIAKKPLPLEEQILQADDETVVKMVKKGDVNQQFWFRGLLTNHGLSNDLVLSCIEEHCDLCEMQDVQRMLSSNVILKNFKVRGLVLKCALNLKTEELRLVVLRHFANVGVTNMVDNSSVTRQLILLLNMMQQDESNNREEFEKKILLLLLQNPLQVLLVLYGECVKNSVYTNCLGNLFESLKDILSLNSLGLNSLSQFLEKCPISHENIQQYSQLLKSLIESDCISYDKFMLNVIVPNLQKASDTENFQQMEPIINLCNEIFRPAHLKATVEEVITLISKILVKSRCTFLNFNPVKQNVTKGIVKFLQNYMTNCQSGRMNINFSTGVNPLNEYYFSKINGCHESTLFMYLFPNFGDVDYHEFLLLFVKYMPMCVTEELQSLTASLDSTISFAKTLELLLDAMLLLCETSKTQTDNAPTILAFRHCLVNYRCTLNELLKSNDRSEGDEVALVKSVCFLMRNLQEDVLEEEGLLLLGLFTDRALKALAKDKQFVCGLLLIKNKQVTQALASKLLG